ncbi:acyltransferase [Bradyrhizobium sp. CW7]|uniref:acyltransferase family protein n=1 Tax=Bradyrhizobium sp. CW7 TaxID=2782688 RepID=UPI001FFB7D20|nr:acyltransferase family protein [Bradyrhizobium sp. CW7]MCK1352668.1 acyltransferase [Bradyrhizobium sp. CW7]
MGGIGYRSDVDGLRAVAVGTVIANHAFERFCPGGFVGVDVFFVISGFLITAILVEETSTGTFSVTGFYARRVRRIFPALILVLAVVLVFGWLHMMPNELLSLARNVFASTLFSANLMLLSEVDYFDLAAKSKPLLHLWSLGVEEQFYLIWPLLLGALAAARLSARKAIVILSAISLAASIYLTRTHPAAAFYLPVSRAWELGTGACLVLFRAEILHQMRSRLSRELAGNLGILAIAAAAVVFNGKTPFPGAAAIVPVLGAALFISAPGSFASTVLSARPPVFIGLISYPLYLWHWPILVFSELFAMHPLSIRERAMCILASTLAATLTFLFVEKPIRRRPFAIPPLVGAMSAIAALGIAVIKADGFPYRIPQEIRQAAVVVPGRDFIRYGECHVSASDHAQLSPNCIEKNRKPLIAVWGDSTAGALAAGLYQLDDRLRPGIAQLTLNSCPPVLVDAGELPPDCVEANKDILARITRAKPDAVLLHAIWNLYWQEPIIGPTVRELQRAGIRTIIVGPVPIWEQPLPRLYAEYYAARRTVLPERTAQFLRPLLAEDGLRQTSNNLGVRFYSPHAVLCDPTGCLTRTSPELRDIVQSDFVHLTPSGAKFVAAKMVQDLGLRRDPDPQATETDQPRH